MVLRVDAVLAELDEGSPGLPFRSFAWNRFVKRFPIGELYKGRETERIVLRSFSAGLDDMDPREAAAVMAEIKRADRERMRERATEAMQRFRERRRASA